MIYVPWIGFFLIIGFLLYFDLHVTHSKPHEVTVSESLLWTGFWILLSLFFTIAVYFIYEKNAFGLEHFLLEEMSGRQAVMDYLTGYIIEKTLSLDNIFVIALIFSYFRIDLKYQHRVLYWGILGAIVLRGLFIWGGIALLNQVDWISYLFGAILLYSAFKLLRTKEKEIDPEHNYFVRLVSRIYPIDGNYHGQSFFTMKAGVRYGTPLILALIMVESSDVMFAVDSIPAIFSITQDPFLVLTSNIFAILGLRSLYFALAAIMHQFRFFNISLTVILGFVGLKMMLINHYHISTSISLILILAILGLGILLSWLIKADKNNSPPGA
ncbi:MAG TPA: hypothetical protein DHU63_09020 [Candidatus Marinimicrobia bacterium]|nr:MAG: hypothetical protein AUJ47_07340 [Candidatus Marinimicrobia bacterium CG1_02_48_14]HCW76666.1 hypothetical protein [Candidatus Neomarinimicrobiota bacterium]